MEPWLDHAQILRPSKEIELCLIDLMRLIWLNFLRCVLTEQMQLISYHVNAYDQICVTFNNELR